MSGVNFLPFISPEAFANDVAAGAFNETQAGVLEAVLTEGGLTDLAVAVYSSRELKALHPEARRELKALIAGLAKRDEAKLRMLLAAQHLWRGKDRVAASRFAPFSPVLVAEVLAKYRREPTAYATTGESRPQNMGFVNTGRGLRAVEAAIGEDGSEGRGSESPPWALQYFNISGHMVRFRVGPEGLDLVPALLETIPEAVLRDSEGVVFHPRFKIVDSKLGIVQFGPGPAARRGLEYQPIRLLTRVLGVQPLPEPLEASGKLEPSPDEFVLAPEDVLQFFMALSQMGAQLSYVIDPGDRNRDEALRRRHFYGDIVATFQTDRVRLTIEANTRFDRRSFFGIGRSFYLVDQGGLQGDRLVLRAELLRAEDTNDLNGNHVLRDGVEDLLIPLMAPTSLVRVVWDSQGHGEFVFQVQNPRPILELPEIMDRKGKFLGSFSPSNNP